MAFKPQSSTHSRRIPWWMVLIGLTIAYAPMYANRLLGLLELQTPFFQGPPSVIVWNWLAVTFLLVFILVVERRSLASIGLGKPSREDLKIAAMFWAVATAVSGVVQGIFPAPPSEGLDQIVAMPLLLLAVLILTTATTEEILYVGYPIERLGEATGYLWLGVTFSFVLFVYPHILFFGPQWLLYQGANLVLGYVLYLWRRNLWACMLMHLLGNSMIFIPAIFGVE